jgi:zinc/manganese transport system substrate-binding protein/zinc transport system substrate-binding protein
MLIRVFFINLFAFLFLASSAWAQGSLLCSTFPMYLFTKNISQGRDTFTIDLMLAGAQGCPHDYAPTPAELERLSQANILVINGRGLEAFLGQALKVAKIDLSIVDASGPVGAEPNAALLLTRNDLMDKGETLLNGEAPPNPHLFAAPSTAARQVERIAEALAALDPGGAELYRANAAKFSEDLRGIAGAFARAGQALGQPKIIASHGIFDFMAQDMGLTLVAAIEEEDGVPPSPARLGQLINLAKEQEVRAILVDPHGNVDLARALGAETKIPVALIDPVDSGPPDAPLEYYQGVMLTDLDVLLKLLTPPQEDPKAKPKPKKGKK